LLRLQQFGSHFCDNLEIMYNSGMLVRRLQNLFAEDWEAVSHDLALVEHPEDVTEACRVFRDVCESVKDALASNRHMRLGAITNLVRSADDDPLFHSPKKHLPSRRWEIHRKSFGDVVLWLTASEIRGQLSFLIGGKCGESRHPSPLYGYSDLHPLEPRVHTAFGMQHPGAGYPATD
jgi:hypothetical protein